MDWQHYINFERGREKPQKNDFSDALDFNQAVIFGKECEQSS